VHRPPVDSLLDLYIRLFLRIYKDGNVHFSLLANILIGIGYGIAGILLLIAADAQM
jgi:hypothetical protein